jgi:AraC family transcriptional regulator
MSSSVLLARDVGAFRLQVVRYAPNHRMAWHSHDEYGVSIVLDGTLAEEARDGSVTAAGGWTVVKPAGTAHANRFGTNPTTLLAFTFREGFDTVAQHRWRWVDQPMTYRAGLRLLRAVTHGVSADRDDALTELIASLGDSVCSSRELPWLRTVRCALSEPGRCESVGTLAARAGVHPVYLARRFRGAFGVSLREFRQITQVRRATALIMGTTRSLSEIAHQCGFSDHSHMCRAFRRVTGVHPGALRAS